MVPVPRIVPIGCGRGAVHVLALWSAYGLLGCSAPRYGAHYRESAPHGGALTLTIENDSLTGSDNNFTNGIGIGWTTDEVGTHGQGSFVRRWTELWSFLPFVLDEDYFTYASWTVGQEMHTPDDIRDPDPPATDQPYAGVLYLDSILAARGHRWEHRWSLRLGIAGPSSHSPSHGVGIGGHRSELVPVQAQHRRRSAAGRRDARAR